MNAHSAGTPENEMLIVLDSGEAWVYGLRSRERSMSEIPIRRIYHA